MDFSEKIKELRLSKGLTLEQVGNKVGVGKSTVRKWENGLIANMKRDKIAKLADALGVSPAYLMGWEEKPAAMSNENELTDALLKRLLVYMKLLNPKGIDELLKRASELVQLPQYVLDGKEK